MLKKIERMGRQLLVRLGAWVLSVSDRSLRPFDAGCSPKILVLRFDERVGNIVLLTPLLANLRSHFPEATITLLGSVKITDLISSHTAINYFIPFDKKKILGKYGPLRTLIALRNNDYDILFDAANPTDPSVTQTLFSRFSGATHTVGVDNKNFGKLYHTAVSLDSTRSHEIDLRLALLQVFPNIKLNRTVTLSPPPKPTNLKVLELINKLNTSFYMVVNIGARLKEKMLDADQYARLAALALAHKLTPVLLYGPSEKVLATAVKENIPQAILAPPTTLLELGYIMQQAACVISCDTGPMHMAVAHGTPTCAIFIFEDPLRYGYPEVPHLVIDARQGLTDVSLNVIQHWIVGTV